MNRKLSVNVICLLLTTFGITRSQMTLQFSLFTYPGFWVGIVGFTVGFAAIFFLTEKTYHDLSVTLMVIICIFFVKDIPFVTGINFSWVIYLFIVSFLDDNDDDNSSGGRGGRKNRRHWKLKFPNLGRQLIPQT